MWMWGKLVLHMLLGLEEGGILSLAVSQHEKLTLTGTQGVLELLAAVDWFLDHP